MNRGINLLECLEQKRIRDEQNYPLTICPCCRRDVDKTEAHSIFDFGVKICKSCALEEKTNPAFNWMNEMEVDCDE